MKEDYEKALKKVTLYPLLKSVSLNRKNYQKQNGPGTGDKSLFRLQKNSEKFLFKLCIIWPSFSKNYIADLCKPFHDIINYSTSVCPFESGKFGKEGKKITKIWISREQKKLFRWNKKHF